APPAGLSAIAVSPSQINLAWADGSPDETGFEIQRKRGVPGGPEVYALIAIVGSAGSGLVVYVDPGRPANTTYTYRVRASNAGGDSPYSTQVSVTTLPSAPGAPDGLTAAALSSTAIRLEWRDNSATESGFQLERSPDAGGNAAFGAIATVGMNVTS